MNAADACTTAAVVDVAFQGLCAWEDQQFEAHGVHVLPSSARREQLRKWFFSVTLHTSALYWTLWCVRHHAWSAVEPKTRVKVMAVAEDAGFAGESKTLLERAEKLFYVRHRARHYCHAVELLTAVADWDRWLRSHQSGLSLCGLTLDTCTCHKVCKYDPREEMAPIMGALSKRALQDIRQTRKDARSLRARETDSTDSSVQCPVVTMMKELAASVPMNLFHFSRESVRRVWRVLHQQRTMSCATERLVRPSLSFVPLLGDSSMGSRYCLRSLDGSRVRLLRPAQGEVAYVHRAVLDAATTVDMADIRLQGGGDVVLTPRFWQCYEGTRTYDLAAMAKLVVCGQSRPDCQVVVAVTVSELRLMYPVWVCHWCPKAARDFAASEPGARVGNALRHRMYQAVLQCPVWWHSGYESVDVPAEVDIAMRSLWREVDDKYRRLCSECAPRAALSVEVVHERLPWVQFVAMDTDESVSAVVDRLGDTDPITEVLRLPFGSLDELNFNDDEVQIFDVDDEDGFPRVSDAVIEVVCREQAARATEWTSNVMKAVLGMHHKYPDHDRLRWDPAGLFHVWELFQPWSDPKLKMDVVFALASVERRCGLIPRPYSFGKGLLSAARRLWPAEQWSRASVVEQMDSLQDFFWSKSFPPSYTLDDDRLICAKDPFVLQDDDDDDQEEV